MSDVVFTSRQRGPSRLSRLLVGVHGPHARPVTEFHGPWGSLAVSESPYSGFDPVESDDHVFVVLAAPVLTYRSNAFLGGSDRTTGSRALYSRWRAGDLDWGRDLSGPFLALIVDKHQGFVHLVTDLMMFVPAYTAGEGDDLVIGSHVDVVAEAAAQRTVDVASLADFVLHGVVTHPFTMYTGVEQCRPATVHEYSPTDRRTSTRSYWVPQEQHRFTHIEEAAAAVRHGLVEHVRAVTSGLDTVAEFISGGEDSRAIAGVLPSRLRRDGYVFLDRLNREASVAYKVAAAYGTSLHVGLRDPDYYLDIMPTATR
ncbi:hypothetical protein PU560_04680, partial [Georgenia sp. 10Sc9-8]|nr:hypothetical protein [Georgenia halotolerans]